MQQSKLLFKTLANVYVVVRQRLLWRKVMHTLIRTLQCAEDILQPPLRS